MFYIDIAYCKHKLTTVWVVLHNFACLELPKSCSSYCPKQATLKLKLDLSLANFYANVDDLLC